MAQRSRPKIIIGIEMRRIRRRPMRSIRKRAAQVRTKFVRATERDVRVGEENPRMVKIVALKYIKEFCSLCISWIYAEWEQYTYEATKLL